MKDVKEYVAAELAKVGKGIVATPTSSQLEEFAKANGGCQDMLLMQMAVQYGAMLALERVQEVLSK